ncbi:MAG: hypothetical protein CO099_06095 [Bdellovibrio sp. CG_4_9_14_3_um_filter_39_7]|nr:MAG: hypothetical protein CO099_06095 [Bdellovibrio sp. CG_4_9_14_3_um_filter_39_7]
MRKLLDAIRKDPIYIIEIIVLFTIICIPAFCCHVKQESMIEKGYIFVPDHWEKVEEVKE